jgi:hypothetical protein
LRAAFHDGVKARLHRAPRDSFAIWQNC